jgi:hypothetical protein
MQAVRPPHTRATTSRTHQFRVRDTSDVRQRSASPQRFCVPLLVSWSSGFHASSRNTSFLPTLVSRSPQFCDLPPPSVLARTRLMRERHCPSRARRSSIHTHSSHASTVLWSAPHPQCCSTRAFRTRTLLTPVTHPRAATTSGSPWITRPQLRQAELCPLSRVLKGETKSGHACEPHAQWFERRSSGSGWFPLEPNPQPKKSA